jgi:p24 family protein delta-1
MPHWNLVQCFRFNVPEDDDAHLVFLALPSSTDDTEDAKTDWTAKSRQLEEYFVEQTYQLTKFRSESAGLPRRFPTEPPEDIAKVMLEFFEEVEQERRSGLQVKVYNPQSSSSRTMETFYFGPVVLNNIRKAIRTRMEVWEAPPLEGYAICFNNMNENSEVQMVMEVVMVSEDIEGEDEKAKGFDASHLTPLAEQLAESINAANSVLKEMHYMEKREQRMRLTADSINTRVRYFSYISVGILLLVTYVQVTYLKRYFRKKKLL